MPRIETVEIKSAYTVPKYHAMIFCTESETETIAAAASTASAIARALQGISETHLMMIRAMSSVVRWKARRCLKRGKCLLITVTAGLPLLSEYHPSEIDQIISAARWTP